VQFKRLFFAESNESDRIDQLAILRKPRGDMVVPPFLLSCLDKILSCPDKKNCPDKTSFSCPHKITTKEVLPCPLWASVQYYIIADDAVISIQLYISTALPRVLEGISRLKIINCSEADSGRVWSDKTLTATMTMGSTSIPSENKQT